MMMLVRRFSLPRYIAQIFGNSGDVLKGRQMPSHAGRRAANYVSWGAASGRNCRTPSRRVGRQGEEDGRRGGRLPRRQRDEQPDFHNAISFAGVFQAPCILIYQNNHWAISVPTARQTASQTLAVKGRALRRAVDPRGRERRARRLRRRRRRGGQARKGGRPSFIEGAHVPHRRALHERRSSPVPRAGGGSTRG